MGGKNLFVYDASCSTIPILNETTPISSITNNNTPSVTINSKINGTISSSLGISSTANGFIGNNTITFNLLVDDTYSVKTVTFTDIYGNLSTITLSTFTINTTPPILVETNPIITPTNDNTPSVTINSNEPATISSSLPFTTTTSGIVGA